MRVQGVDGSDLASLQRETKAQILLGRQRADLRVDLNEIKARPEALKEGQAEEDAKGIPDREKLEEAVEKANKTMETYSTELRFSIHEASGEIMVKVINTRDNSVIREIPPERILDFVAHVKKMLGIIIDKFI